MTARTVGAESHTVVSTTEICLVLGVTVYIAELVLAVSELTLLTILAAAVLLVGSA